MQLKPAIIFFFAVLLLGSSLPVLAQHDERIATPAGKPSAAARFGAGITADAVRQQLQVVAAPEMAGRETATEGQRKAAAYIISRFAEAGLQPGANGQWEQYFYLYQDTLTASTLTLNGQRYTFGEDYYSSLKECSNQQLRASRIIFAGYGINTAGYNNYQGMEVAGNVVLILPGEPHKNDTTFVLSGTRRPSSWGGLGKKIAEAAAREAAAVLVVNEGASRIEQVAGDRLRRTGIYTEDARQKKNKMPNVYFISPQMAAGLLNVEHPEDLLEQAVADRLTPRVIDRPVQIQFKKGTRELRSSNVLAYLEGTDKKDEVVFVTAHYDHLGTQDGQIYYGADDDGSGTVAVLEIAAAFARAKEAGYPPRRSLVFMAVSGEEKGLLGSKYYTEHPIYPLEKTVVDLNIDMIGRVDPMHEKDTNYVYIIGDDKLSSALRPINEKANEMFTRLHLDYKYNDPDDPNRFYYRSDHYMFARHDIPVIFYFNGTHEDYHRSTDTVEKIDYPLLSRRAQLVFYTAWEIANREERLTVDRHRK
ncbi:M28 family peptidase [Chitinophaga japonensis]|uniref:Peptidase M28-like protein n=1 Tax=Chitinophaga japonensis TaxID=104662 RepID=A0A562TF35_CHIJA|nr:M28 family peptidase [Chitinophaga japonensis]TWI91993.1 peptidase M28-like protein [Chitinophaga japonensis]